MKTLTALALTALLVTGCREGTIEPTAPATAQVGETMHSVRYAPTPGVSHEDGLAATQGALRAVSEVVAASDNWAEAHAAVQTHLATMEPGLARETFEQMAAKSMLYGYLIPNPDDPRAAELALGYARRLGELGSPETQTITDAVEAFEGHWGEAETRAVATKAVTALEAYAAGLDCVDCVGDDEAARSLRATGNTRDVFLSRQASAADALRRRI